jgi:hypothetical protein
MIYYIYQNIIKLKYKNNIYDEYKKLIRLSY